MSIAANTINQTLVKVFNQIMRIEEVKLKSFGSDLSVKEAHVIEAVVASGENNTMTEIAKRLGVTVGSLTVAISTLKKKGYVSREKSNQDKRRIHILPTEKAITINQLHEGFHAEMTRAAIAAVSETELTVLVQALEGINTYFAHEGE